MSDKIKDVFTIIEHEGDKAVWIKIGTAFVNRDESITVSLNALPINGRLHIRSGDVVKSNDEWTKNFRATINLLKQTSAMKRKQEKIK